MRNTVSCIIRTYNEAKYAGKLIEALHSQNGACEHLEIVVVDSGSTDATVEIARNCGARLIEIPKKDFNYSKALNLGIENSMGDLILILSAHSMPCENDWLLRMVRHFENGNVAGVFCRQVPWPDADAHEIIRIEKTFGPVSETFDGSSGHRDIPFSNAASCIRRGVWREHPFVVMPAAEDREWARWAIVHGYEIVYEAEAAVYHSHNESCRKTSQRKIQIEKAADAKLLRKRDFFFTVRQALGWLVRDSVKVYSSDYFRSTRMRDLWKCALRSFWFVVDFNQKS
ncbi:MAG TPA: glycosyltransferase [Sedimentisphaerales bacterium]|nr:glycosyltransferase [Sedimentisphaerales bacterium]